ncbi:MULTISPECIES: glycoside hydrolase family 35 protein [Streptomyces]|uniref:glycoside hydrolase family 35 protein n=1 Tax=Streptomyces TaxID=1883 RepID=UPI0013162912|nr:MULTISPECIES: beta-galactosidase family protein [Streptomyces]QGZ48444.1 beta-galactosidase [Streptomyces sp. QHH-9511]GGT65159.1 beta-galactosidase [Streptomyces lateritius]
MSTFAVGDEDFLLDGRPVRLLSGALHYFRVHEEQWGHRLEMLRAMGLNCVETYVPWNLYEPEPGRYGDVGALGRFLDAVERAGMWAIVRPGPYICAEWENGGLPHWLTGRLGRRARTDDAEYMEHVERWFRALLPQVVARQIDRGGPVIMVQVENEYGSFGSDQGYLRRVADLLLDCGVGVPLFTSDGPEDHMLTGGSVPGVLATANFGSGAREAFAALRRHRPSGPLMCMEFWCGWFDHWGTERSVRDAEDAAATLREILECGASVNLYMAHGGTNFAGWAGANRDGALHEGELRPTVTSYDYGAPVDEAGLPTEKYWRFREVLAAFADGPLPEVPGPPRRIAAPAAGTPAEWAPLGEVLEALGDEEVVAPVPPTFEELGVDRGVVRYRVEIPGPRQPYPLSVSGLRDRATVLVDGVRAGVLTTEDAVLPEPVAGPAVVELWVESLGRVNYGPRQGEMKGVTGGVRHERQYVHGVRARGLRLDAFEAGAVRKVPFRPVSGDGARPGLYRAAVEVAGPGDAALSLPGAGRGFVWVNGFCLGRYWDVGPQDALFVPGPVLREGGNEVWVLELEGGAARVVLA